MHQYTNTVLVKVAYRNDMCYIFENVMVRRPQKQCFQVSDLQIHEYSIGQIHVKIQKHKYYLWERPCSLSPSSRNRPRFHSQTYNETLTTNRQK